MYAVCLLDGGAAANIGCGCLLGGWGVGGLCLGQWHILTGSLRHAPCAGKSDPFVEVFTTLDKRLKTRVIKNNLHPVWEESFYLPVLERDQVLRLEVFDHDAVNLTGAMTLQVGHVPGPSPCEGGAGSRSLRACLWQVLHWDWQCMPRAEVSPHNQDKTHVHTLTAINSLLVWCPGADLEGAWCCAGCQGVHGTQRHPADRHHPGGGAGGGGLVRAGARRVDQPGRAGEWQGQVGERQAVGGVGQQGPAVSGLVCAVVWQPDPQSTICPPVQGRFDRLDADCGGLWCCVCVSWSQD